MLFDFSQPIQSFDIVLFPEFVDAGIPIPQTPQAIEPTFQLKGTNSQVNQNVTGTVSN